jgi:hypothetical protein
MAAFPYRNNKEYLVHVIAVLRIIKQNGMELDVRKAFQALVQVRKEMKPLFKFPEDETEAQKEIRSICFPNTKRSSRPRRVSQSLKPRRLMKCSLFCSQ